MANTQSVSRMVEIHDVVDVRGASMEAPTNQQLIDFVIHEARLIDQHRLAEWLDSSRAVAIYRSALAPGQTHPRLPTSLMYQNNHLLTNRNARLKGKRT